MKIILRLVSLLIMVLLTGCFAGKTKPQTTYLLTIPQPPKQAVISKKTAALEVSSMEAVPPFTTYEFIYRITQNQYLLDYYNVFLVPVSEQLTEVTVGYLMNKRLSVYIASPLQPVANPQYLLKSSLVGMYADYRNSTRPQGVVAIRYLLIENSNKKNKIIMDRTYQESVPLQAKTSVALINAWNVGVGRIMANLCRNLASIVR